MATENVLYNYTVTATDPEGAAVTFTLAAGPAGMLLDENTGSLTWTPSAADVGQTYTVEIHAVDPFGLAGMQTYQLEVRATNVIALKLYVATKCLLNKPRTKKRCQEPNPVSVPDYRGSACPIAIADDSVKLVQYKLAAWSGPVFGHALERPVFLESPLGRSIIIVASLTAILYFVYYVIWALWSREVHIGKTSFRREEKYKDYWYHVGTNATVALILIGSLVYSLIKWF